MPIELYDEEDIFHMYNLMRSGAVLTSVAYFIFFSHILCLILFFRNKTNLNRMLTIRSSVVNQANEALDSSIYNFKRTENKGLYGKLKLAWHHSRRVSKPDYMQTKKIKMVYKSGFYQPPIIYRVMFATTYFEFFPIFLTSLSCCFAGMYFQWLTSKSKWTDYMWKKHWFDLALFGPKKKHQSDKVSDVFTHE